MKSFDETFDKIFCKFLHYESFRVPMSVKELQLFSKRVCRSILLELSETSNSYAWSESESVNHSKAEQSRLLGKNNDLVKNTPIGLNILSKTFNILKTVGRGNFGTVFKAENKFDHRLFALKQVKITPKEDLKKVLQEVENLAKAKHKNIVKYLDCFLVQEESEANIVDEESDSVSYDELSDNNYFAQHSDSSLFINFDKDVSILKERKDPLKEVGSKTRISAEKSSSALISSERPSSSGISSTITCICIKMEFCDFTLEQLLQILKENNNVYKDCNEMFENLSALVEFEESKTNAKFGAFSPLFIIHQLLEGLCFIHELGIVHRDLKPANIFIMHDGKVKIGDFGLSKDLSKECSLSKIYAAGTRFYMAPEFVNMKAMALEEVYFPPADMFSLGMVIIMMLGFLGMGESEMFRLSDKLRRNPKKEVEEFLNLTSVQEVSVGTTKGNLSSSTKNTYFPLLLDFLQDLLTSLLDYRPKHRMTAVRSKQMTNILFAKIFCGNNFFRPKIGTK